jgi:uncharacterized protein (DUF58 family)
MKPRPTGRSTAVRYRLTRAGLLFLLLAVTLGAAAVKTQGAMMFILCGAMLGAVVSSALMGRRMLGSLRVRRELPQRTWQNQTVHIGYDIRNTHPRSHCLGLKMEELDPGGISIVPAYCLHLPPRGTFRAGARFVALRRGRISLGAIRVSTCFPFGLVQATRDILRPADLIVWPARGRLTRQLLHRGAVETSGLSPSAVSGGQDEFFGLREYRDGDSPRWIHWRKTATRGALVVREMAHPSPDSLYLVIDAALRHGDQQAADHRERLLRLAATLVDHAFARGYQVGMALACGGRARSLAVSADNAHRTALLDALADVAPGESLGLETVLGALRRAPLRRSQVLLIAPSAPADGQSAQRLRSSARHFTLITDRDVEAVFADAPAPLMPPQADAKGAS